MCMARKFKVHKACKLSGSKLISKKRSEFLIFVSQFLDLGKFWETSVDWIDSSIQCTTHSLYIIMMPGNIDTIIEMPMLAVPTLWKNKTEKAFITLVLYT